MVHTLDHLVQRIAEFVDIPTDSAARAGLVRGRTWLTARLRSAGFDEIEEWGQEPPIVTTRREGSGSGILIAYLMYDTRANGRPVGPTQTESVDGIGRCLVGGRPLGNKPAIELFLSAVETARRIPSLIVIAEGDEVQGSPKLRAFLDAHPSLLHGAAGVIWPRTLQHLDGSVRFHVGYRGLLGLRLSVSSARWGRGPKDPDGAHTQFRPVIDAPTWHLVDALGALAANDGKSLRFRLEPQIPGLGSDADSGAPETDLGVNLEFEGQPIVGVGRIHSSAAVRLQFRIPPGISCDTLCSALGQHLRVMGYADVVVEPMYSIDGARTDPDSALVRAVIDGYRHHGAKVDVISVGTASPPVSEFGARGLAFADAGLGYQDDRRALLALEAGGHRAGVLETVDFYRELLQDVAD